MVKDTRRLRVILAGLIILVILVSLTAYLSTWKPSINKQGLVVEEQSPEVSGRILIYVNNRLAYSGQVHSFLKPVPTFLALGLFPTSGLQSAVVTFYSENTSTWSTAINPSTVTYTIYYGGKPSLVSVWGTYNNITPLLLVYDTKGNKWAEISLSTTPNIVSNSTGVVLTISGSITPSLSSATNVSMIRLVRPTMYQYYAVRFAEDTLSTPVTVNPGDSLTIVYQFYFKSSQLFTMNWANITFAWLYNVPGAKIPVKTIDGSTDYIDPLSTWQFSPSDPNPANNVPVDTFIVVGNGQASFSRTAYKVVSEVTRAEPSIQTYGGGVSLSYAFTFSQDTTITELAVYSKLTDDKYVMLLYYVLPQPVTAKAGTPFSVTFYISLPYQDRV